MFLMYYFLCWIDACDVNFAIFIIIISKIYVILLGAADWWERNDITVLAYQEELIMLNFDNKPYIYLCLEINSNTLGIKHLLFRHYLCIFIE